jgi:hypothetical protein
MLMMARRSWSVVILLAAACARDTIVDDAGAAKADVERGEEQARIVPEGLSVSALAGGTGGLELTALTLQRKGSEIELYAALKNVGNVPACSAAFSIELFDLNGQSLAAGIGGLLTQRFYRRTDGSGTIAACVGPGDMSMTAVAGLPPELAIEEVRSLIYRCPYFALDVEPIAGVTIAEVNEVERSGGTVFEGTLVNGLDVALKSPSVSVFAIDRVGRPLGVARASEMTELAPGGEWRFVTDAVADRGVRQLAFTAGELAN